MSDLQYFQRYHGKENTHSSNALLLLKRLYFYNPKKFYDVLIGLLQEQSIEKITTEFIAQDTKIGKTSVPDFSIGQESFKIIVEAKEKGTKFYIDQLERHLKGLTTSDYKYKVLITLSPTNNVQHLLNLLKEKTSDIYIVHKTYMDFYDTIKGNLDEIKDLSFIEILEDYKDYCEEDGLIDYSDDTVMVRLTNDTYDFNFKTGIYYDTFNTNPYGYKYLGLYKEQHVKAIGKIVKIVEAHTDANNEIQYGNIIGKPLTEDDKKKISLAIENRRQIFHNETSPHWHFIVEKFVEVNNFKKKKYSLCGKKKFYLKEDFNIENYKNCTIEQIAVAMKDYDKWE